MGRAETAEGDVPVDTVTQVPRRAVLMTAVYALGERLTERLVLSPGEAADWPRWTSGEGVTLALLTREAGLGL